MVIKLNATPEVYKEFSEEATGHARNVDQMPVLIAEGRVPMNTAQFMQRRLQFRNGPSEVKSAWIDNYFDTGDAVIYHPNGDVKVVLDAQPLREMTPESQRNGGALVLDEDVYRSLPGEVFKKGNLGKVNGFLSKEEVKAHPVWKVLARDQSLLNDYTDMIFAESMERFGYDTTMGFYPGFCDRNKIKMRAFYIGELAERSSAYGTCDIDWDCSRLVGIALGHDIPNIRKYSMPDLFKQQ